MNDEALRQFTHDRRQQRESEAQAERLARLARGRRHRRADEMTPPAGLWLLLAARRHVTP
mgnify:CR=1 FL=1